MTVATYEVARTNGGLWRRRIAVAAVATAAVLLAALVWSTVQVGWFAQTSDYCATTPCSGAAMDELWQGYNRSGPASTAQEYHTLMANGEDALLAESADLAVAMAYLPFTAMLLAMVLILLAIATMAWGWTPSTWRHQWNQRPRPPAVRVAGAVLVGLVSFLLLYAANLQAMLWVTHVTE